MGNQSLAIINQDHTPEVRSWTDPRSIEEAQNLANLVAASSYAKAFGVRSKEDAFVIVATGHELGMSALQAFRNIYTVNGRPTLSAAMMMAMVLRNTAVCEYFTLRESSDEIATYETKRRGAPDPVVMSFTIDQAKAAGALSKDTWRKFPAAMLRARASSALARAVFPDLVAGIYVPEEMGAEVDEEGIPIKGQAPIDITPPPAAVRGHVINIGEVPSWFAANVEKLIESELRRDHFSWLPGMQKMGQALHERGLNTYDELYGHIAQGFPLPGVLRKEVQRGLQIFNALRELRNESPVDGLPKPAPEPVVEVLVDDGAELEAEIVESRVEDAAAESWWTARLPPNVDPVQESARVMIDVLGLGAIDPQRMEKRVGRMLYADAGASGESEVTPERVARVCSHAMRVVGWKRKLDAITDPGQQIKRVRLVVGAWMTAGVVPNSADGGALLEEALPDGVIKSEANVDQLSNAAVELLNRKRSAS